MSDDPGQPRLPEALRCKEATDSYKSICQYLAWAKENVWSTMMAEQRLRAEHMTFLFYGFIAETGLTPSECMLVEKRTEKGDMLWGYVKRHPGNEKFEVELLKRDAEIARLSGLVKYCESVIKEMREEVAHLRSKL